MDHYVSDDNDINKKWQTGNQSPPSSMIPTIPRNSGLLQITDIDVQKVREIYGIDINNKENTIKILFNGNGLLYNMVRIIVGILIEGGLGKIKPEKMKEILNKEDRQSAGPTAPPQGIFLYDIEY